MEPWGPLDGVRSGAPHGEATGMVENSMGLGIASGPYIPRAHPRGRLMGLVLAAACLGPLACGEPVAIDHSGPTADWPHYGGDTGGTRFSPLTQIDPGNVDRLEVAWTYHTGDVLESDELGLGTSFQNTPILVDDTLYLCSPRNKAIALDAETGEERWVFDAQIDTEGVMLLVCRGVSYWRDPEAKPASPCAERVFMGTLDARMIALDAKTGRLCEAFGEGGEIDLSKGIGHRYPGEYAVTSPPLILGDRLVTGAMVLDNIRVDAPGGVVRAYDPRTGDLLWSWDPLPPGRTHIEGIDESGETVRYQRGTTNACRFFRETPSAVSFSCLRAIRRPIISALNATVSTITRVRSLRSPWSRVSRSGIFRQSITMSGITMSPPSPPSSIFPGSRVPCRRLPRAPSSGTSFS